jgi:thiosulfate dehydrogenase [quinone] large subunit
MKPKETLTELLRLALGFIFLWTFLDKTFGLGFSTAPERAWLAGVSPTTGYLVSGTGGPMAAMFQSLGGSVFVDWLFMIGMLGTGLALILGMGMRIAAYAGSLMMLLIYSSQFPPANNPVVDQHLIYILLLLFLKDTAAVHYSLRPWWIKTPLVKRWPILA